MKANYPLCTFVDPISLLNNFPNVIAIKDLCGKSEKFGPINVFYQKIHGKGEKKNLNTRKKMFP